ncbi:MAG TPA: 50S ribosomal protein L21 [Solirubrobacteraceae bacterium]|nr:50S ribosomal protein L21 [Solirubrobacteraceae bacterium]
MYAIVKTGGKQYRVEQGQSLLVERLPAEAGAKVALEPLLYRGDDKLLDGAELQRVSVQATVLGHERGPKLRVFKYRPKRGYKRRTGHRQELTRLEVTEIKATGAAAKPKATATPKDADAKPTDADAKPTGAAAKPKPVAAKPKAAAAKPKTAAAKPKAPAKRASTKSDPKPAAADKED